MGLPSTRAEEAPLEASRARSELLTTQRSLRDARRGLGRDATNLEYVKNLVVQFLSLRPGSSEHASLVPVLATVLAFTDEDLAGRRAAARREAEASRGWFGAEAPPNPFLGLTQLAPAPRDRLDRAASPPAE